MTQIQQQFTTFLLLLFRALLLEMLKLWGGLHSILNLVFLAGLF